MAFEDGLTDTAIISSVSTSKSAAGELVKSYVVVYNNQACKLLKGQNTPIANPTIGQSEDPRTNWTLLLPATVTGILKGYRVRINSVNYMVTEVHPVRGDSTSTHHYVLFLQEKE